MNSIMLNQFFSNYFVLLIYEFFVFFILCKSYKLKTSKRTAYITVFLFSNFLPITDSLSTVLIGNGVITITERVALILKFISIIEESIIILFIILILDIAWYRSYWISIFLHAVLSLPLALYYNKFLKVDELNRINIIPFTLELLPNYLIVLLISIGWGSIFIWLGKYLKRLKKMNQISKWSWLIVYSIWAYIFINSDKNYINGDNQLMAGIGNFKQVLLVITAMIIVLLISISYSDKKLLKVENKLLKEQVELQYANYLILQQQEIKIHKLYHDIGNHIKTIQILVANDENQEAKQYTESLALQYKNIQKEIYCNNKIINAVLSQKLNVCNQERITYEVDIQIPDVLPITDIDLMCVYSNLLDNALESCQRNKDTDNYIIIKTALIGNYFTVKVINSKPIVEKVKKGKDGYKTTKADKIFHGYGLRIIDEIIERYEGQKELLDKGSEFSAMVMLKAQ